MKKDFLESLYEFRERADDRQSDALTPLMLIPRDKIDSTRSRILSEGDFTKVEIVSKDGHSYPLAIWLGHGDMRDVASIRLGSEGDLAQIDLLSLQEIGSDSELDDFVETLKPALTGRILQTDTFAASQLVRRVVEISTFRFSDGGCIPFTYRLRHTWPWQEKIIKETEFEPWIDR